MARRPMFPKLAGWTKHDIEPCPLYSRTVNRITYRIALNDVYQSIEGGFRLDKHGMFGWEAVEAPSVVHATPAEAAAAFRAGAR